ncbi:hypothetical protein HYW39_02260 [Candidatus Curtissbacteria bacterium]|nr:hypothetical protein [Candidatus Curtissbacteria bacterium]
MTRENSPERTTLLGGLSFGLRRLHYERTKQEISQNPDFAQKLYDAHQALAKGTTSEFPFSGEEIAAYLELQSGPQIGKLLKELDALRVSVQGVTQSSEQAPTST